MRERSIKCALWLRKNGIQKGDRIGIWTDSHIDTYVPVYASLYVAAVICPWDDEVSKSMSFFYVNIFILILTILIIG